METAGYTHDAPMPNNGHMALTASAYSGFAIAIVYCAPSDGASAGAFMVPELNADIGRAIDTQRRLAFGRRRTQSLRHAADHRQL